jgi:indolepyruvate ferredoxin oxidoreductase beta subunit
MKQDIIIAGVGGQGILSIAFVLVNSAMLKGLNSKQSEVHGMSQRGGPVFAYVRISDETIYSDLIPTGEADMIIGLEAMESLRYAQFLKKGGNLIVDHHYILVNGYDKTAIDAAIEQYPRHIWVNAQQIAREVGNPLTANMVMMGAASPLLSIEETLLKDSIRTLFARKSEDIITINLAAFDRGAELGKRFLDKAK